MAITINWGTKVIFVPKADLDLIQSTPTEIRELDLNAFRLSLKDLEDSEDGMPCLDTHRHNTEVTLAGITFARVIEIINGYTVSFEDGQYAVNLVGANSNVGDVINVNQVSVRSANSAGLISNPAIEYASFDGGVTVDLTSSYSGTIYPTGTPRRPVNNLTDALLILRFRGFRRIYIVGDAEIDTGGDFSEIAIVGESITNSLLTIASDADVTNSEFSEATITGTLDGNNKIDNCLVLTLNYMNGVISDSLLGEGTITLGGNADAYVVNCSSGVAGLGTPIINMGGSGQSLNLRNYNGGIKITNKTGADVVSVDLNSGKVILDDTVTNGMIICRGVGELLDKNGDTILSGMWNTNVVIQNNTLDTVTTALQVWGTPVADNMEDGSFGAFIGKKLLTVAKYLGLK